MSEITRELVDQIGDAFNAMEIEAVMEHFADDAIFEHAIGPEAHGVRLEGADAIRAAFSGLFDKVERVHWDTLDARIIGDKAYCEYYRQVAHKDGSTEACNSVDILTFREQKIVKKDTYFKQVT